MSGAACRSQSRTLGRRALMELTFQAATLTTGVSSNEKVRADTDLISSTVQVENFRSKTRRRSASDAERAEALLRGAKGKRLLYQQPDQAPNT